MKILAPVSSLDSAIRQIAAGAGEIYVGGDTGVFNSFSFSGRGKYNPKQEKICPDKAELEEIVRHAHEHKVTVMYVANLPFMANDTSGGKSFINHFYDYISQGLAAQVDSVVVADIGAIMFLRNEGINIHLTASTFLEAATKEQILFYKELGVDRAVLSYQVTLAEIEELTRHNIMEIEVFGHYGCSFYDGYCNLKHSFGETTETCIGIPCQNSYQLKKGDTVLAEGQVLNASLACSLCSLYRLKQAGVYALKMVGRARDIAQNVQITQVYAQMLAEIEKARIEEPITQEVIDRLREKLLPRWWRQGLCRTNMCKYKENVVTSTFVNL